LTQSFYQGSLVGIGLGLARVFVLLVSRGDGNQNLLNLKTVSWG